MRFYISQTIGDGASEDTAFRPAIDNHVNQWRITDMRGDPKVAGLTLADCNPTTAEHNAIVADSLNTYVDTQDLGLDDLLSNHTDLTGLFDMLESYQIPCDDFDGTFTFRQLTQRMIRRFLVLQLLTGKGMPAGLETYLTTGLQTAEKAKANTVGVSPVLNAAERDKIKEVVSLPSIFMKTHYDG